MLVQEQRGKDERHGTAQPIDRGDTQRISQL
jgi:hypothetical protein